MAFSVCIGVGMGGMTYHVFKMRNLAKLPRMSLGISIMMVHLPWILALRLADMECPTSS